MIYLLPLAGKAQVIQDSLWTIRDSIPCQAFLAIEDNLGQIFVVTPDFSIQKYAADGHKLNRYSQTRLGPVSSLDATNPLKLLVWYPEFSTVLWLDRSMTSLGALNLIDAGFPNVRTLAQARDGNLWVYDEPSFKLMKITPSGIKLFESAPINQLLDLSLSVNRIREESDGVYLSDPNFGVLRFDNYAQFRSAERRSGVLDLRQGINGNLQILTADSLSSISFSLAPPAAPLPLPEHPEILQLWLGHEHLLAQTRAQLYILEPKQK
ncbi:MAG: hypothetical protein IPL65_00160 [Lewinellaceae bacterium]|nr:hypothetical protein [Lewinellaceae bacterium]